MLQQSYSAPRRRAAFDLAEFRKGLIWALIGQYIVVAFVALFVANAPVHFVPFFCAALLTSFASALIVATYDMGTTWQEMTLGIPAFLAAYVGFLLASRIFGLDIS